MRRIQMSTQFTLIILLVSFNLLHGQNKSQTDNNLSSYILHDTIVKMDSLLFSAFNNRDINKFMTYFSKDVEFYHDKGGLTHYDETIKNTKKLFEQNTGLKRTLIKNSLEIYPINNYGAVQIGIHKFCHEENGKNDCGEFKFVHLWKRENNSWILTRIISYDH